MPPIGGGRSGLTLTDGARPDGERDGLIALGDDLVRKGPKWHAALGAVDPGRALDGARPARLRAPGRLLLAVRAAVRHRRSRRCATPRTAPTTAPSPGSAPPTSGCSASAWCDLDDLDRALPELDAALDLGLREIWIPARAPGGRAPGHVDHDPFWARLAERGVPFVLHVGSGALGIGDAWLDNGRPLGEEMTGAEIIGSKDFTVVYQIGRAVPRRARARRRARALPDAARRRHRDGRRVGAGDAAPPRPRRRHLEAVRAAPRDVPAARRPSRPRPSCASRRTRSRTSAGCSPSPTRRCTCSRRTTRTPRAAATRSGASTARWPRSSTARRPPSTPTTRPAGSASPDRPRYGGAQGRTTRGWRCH